MNESPEFFTKRLWQDSWEIFQNESCWIVGDYARSANGVPVSSDDPSACRWCSLGVILYNQSRLSKEFSLYLPEINQAVNRLISGLAYKYDTEATGALGASIAIVDFNDLATYSEVLEFWREFGEQSGYID